MTQPRLGNAIIINSVCDSMPGSRLDAASLESAYETVGFDVFVCNDFNSKVRYFLLTATALLSELILDNVWQGWVVVTQSLTSFCETIQCLHLLLSSGTGKDEDLDHHGSDACVLQRLCACCEFRVTDAGELLDCRGEAFTSVKELVNELLRVETLKNKPKLVNIHTMLDGNCD